MAQPIMAHAFSNYYSLCPIFWSAFFENGKAFVFPCTAILLMIIIAHAFADCISQDTRIKVSAILVRVYMLLDKFVR